MDPALAEELGHDARVIKERQKCLGVYGSTVQPGRVTVGDLVYLEG